MDRLRQARPEDIDTLLGLAHTGNFINLPPFKDRIAQMLETSARSFDAVREQETPPENHDRTHDNYIFVLETDEGECLGTSAIRGGMIATDHPNLSYQLIKMVRESTLLSKTVHEPDQPDNDDDRMIVSGRMEHVYAILFQDTACPTELGGNVMRHNARGRGLGKLLSYARFHYLKEHTDWFSNRILAEMMAPIDEYNDGTPFWRGVIRKFINMSYEDADRLSTHMDKREFMYELLPKFVNLSLLNDDVLTSLGSIGVATRPAAEMLRDLGFTTTHRIDPFDAGPHLEMRLSTMKALACAPAIVEVGEPGRDAIDALVSTEDSPNGFVAIRTRVEHPFTQDKGCTPVIISHDAANALKIANGATVTVSPLKFQPDRPRPEAIPVIHLRDEIRRRRPDVMGQSLAALPFNEVAQIVQDRVDQIGRDLQDD
ncbi:MAG: arginine N-succinyltransferase [Phycisphaerales bacterium]|nr:arginine N-succinyltransferase [Phycisphaerales bacterium]